jgi:hypothetical protein
MDGYCAIVQHSTAVAVLAPWPRLILLGLPRQHASGVHLACLRLQPAAPLPGTGNIERD